jgi:hypothetical protein
MILFKNAHLAPFWNLKQNAPKEAQNKKMLL